MGDSTKVISKIDFFMGFFIYHQQKLLLRLHIEHDILGQSNEQPATMNQSNIQGSRKVISKMDVFMGFS
ncbi:MAG TPA: hypothetical protein DCM60_05400 [Nitrospina sp.]|nr:hypothetical protein [Nitrospina sp.]